MLFEASQMAEVHSVTRNTKAFIGTALGIYDPSEFLAQLNTLKEGVNTYRKKRSTLTVVFSPKTGSSLENPNHKISAILSDLPTDFYYAEHSQVVNA